MDTRYGRWTLVDPEETGQTVLARCDCGTVRRIKRGKLVSGHSKSCGCWKHEFMAGRTAPNLAPERDTVVEPGARFGRWTALSAPYGVPGKKNRVAICVCDCGTEKSDVVVGHLLSGKTRSCGCLRADFVRALHHSTPNTLDNSGVDV